MTSTNQFGTLYFAGALLAWGFFASTFGASKPIDEEERRTPEQIAALVLFALAGGLLLIACGVTCGPRFSWGPAQETPMSNPMTASLPVAPAKEVTLNAK